MEEKPKKYIYYEELQRKNGTRYNSILENNESLSDYSSYAPSCNKLFHVFEYCFITKKDSILDIGCGRGFVLLVCALFPFHKIGGVEISKPDFDACKEIIKNYRNIDIYHQDILDFDFWQNYNFFYFYNPFSHATFAKILVKLPEKCTIIYKNIHEEEKIMLESERFSLKKIIEGEDRPYFIFIR